MKVVPARASDLEILPGWIEKLELDASNLKREDFFVAKKEEEIVGFVRIKDHLECEELSTLGVLTHHQKKGIGTALINVVIEKSTKDLYLVTIIPEYFSKYGFKETQKGHPDSISKKHHFCSTVFHMDIPYVVMKYEK